MIQVHVVDTGRMPGHSSSELVHFVRDAVAWLQTVSMWSEYGNAITFAPDGAAVEFLVRDDTPSVSDLALRIDAFERGWSAARGRP